MIVIDNTIVSDDLLIRQFACSLDKCKGACCVAGDSGAPLDYDETAILDEIAHTIKPYLTEEGNEAIQKFGNWLIDSEGDFVTPLVKGVKQCAYAFFENGIAKCAIEKAYYEGKISFKKPVSCHLYPVRITRYQEYDAVNYNQWDVCSPACANGKEQGIAVYEFVKEALIRKYGNEWYEQLIGASAYLATLPDPKK